MKDIITVEQIAMKLCQLKHFWFNGKPKISIVETPNSYFNKIQFDFNKPNENDPSEIKHINFYKGIDKTIIEKRAHQAVDGFSKIVDSEYKRMENERTNRR